MEGYIKPIGGEFWFETDFISNHINNFKSTNAVLLNGGQSAIEFILQEIDLKKNDYILMPSYLCPTILYKFKSKCINILFYQINEDLSINIENVNSLVKEFNIKALFFINYFGFYHDEETLNSLKCLKEKGIILIEDAVQMLWFNKLNKFIGDYIFNSYRKFFPCDGSVVLLNSKSQKDFQPIEDNYYNLILKARHKKTQYIKNQIGSENDFLDKFTEADEWYYKRENIYGIDEKSKEMLSHIDYEKVKQQRIDNYIYLYDKLKKFSKINILFDYKRLEDNSPLAFPVLINNRDFIRRELRKYNIYCPVHWDITEEIWAKDFPSSLTISKSVLSIPIDWRYNFKDLDYFLNKFKDILND